MATHGETVCAELVAHGAVAKVVPLLKSFDLEILHMALTFFEATLRYCDSVSVLTGMRCLIYVDCYVVSVIIV